MTPSISLCVITGNEAATIERFLDSFKDAFDQLCIVRAVGATPHDKTLTLAKAWCSRNGKDFAADEYRNAINPDADGATAPNGVDRMNPATWPHVDDFAAARNKAWGLATCPWQFWADVDDILLPGSAELIRLCAASDKHDQIFFKYDLRSQSESNVRERMFRRGISRWVQPVHEQCRLAVPPPQGLAAWRGLIEERIVFEHAPTAEKERDPMRNRRIMAYHCRWIHAYCFELHREWFYQWQATHDPKEAEEATKWAEIAHQTDCLPEQRYDMLLHQAEIASFRDVEHAIDLCWSAIRINPRNRSAWGDLAQYELRAGRGGVAVTATGFMQSIPKPSASGYPVSDRYHGWEGAHLRIRSLRAAGNEAAARKAEADIFAKHGCRISLLHATRGRPQQAIDTRNLWFRAAVDPLAIEHIFAVDSDDAESIEAFKHYRHVVVDKPNGCVKAWNMAAADSSGHVLVQLSDDWVPCHDWDALIWEALGIAALERLNQPIKSIDGTDEEIQTAMVNAIASMPLVLAVSDGHRSDQLLCMAILTRKRYEQQGNELFSAEYFGVYSDTEFTVRAHDDGVVIDARHILFDHRHPIFQGKPVEEWDETHRRQNAPERYAEGKAIFNRRNPKHAIP